MNNNALLSIVIVITVLIFSGCIVSEDTGFFGESKEDACKNSGGTVTTQLCCQSASDFPNTCLIGACGCSPTSSHEINVCDCGEGKCWNGNTCE